MREAAEEMARAEAAKWEEMWDEFDEITYWKNNVTHAVRYDKPTWEVLLAEVYADDATLTLANDGEKKEGNGNVSDGDDNGGAEEDDNTGVIALQDEAKMDVVDDGFEHK